MFGFTKKSAENVLGRLDSLEANMRLAARRHSDNAERIDSLENRVRRLMQESLRRGALEGSLPAEPAEVDPFEVPGGIEWARKMWERPGFHVGSPENVSPKDESRDVSWRQFEDFLVSSGACSEAVAWVREKRYSALEAVMNCDRVEWLSWLAEKLGLCITSSSGITLIALRGMLLELLRMKLPEIKRGMFY